MAFFEASTRRPPPAPPEWLAPPTGSVGSLIPVQRVLARRGGVLIALHSLLAFPSGCLFSFRLAARLAGRDVSDTQRVRAAFGVSTWSHDTKAAGDPFRCGVRLPDGNRATSVDLPPVWDPTRPELPTRPVFAKRPGLGTHVMSDDVLRGAAYWLWPLPPPSPITLAVEWTELGVPLTETELDGALIAAGARTAVQLWPDAPDEQ